ncbi:hypothetical protein [Pseudosulfitobacter sp. SM2401]|uniref:hypothetical protein n=1 Tax=Pseudosulfitobacter sp. SM2401 TaxID=3350098 RepID=UPI0036F3DC37
MRKFTPCVMIAATCAAFGTAASANGFYLDPRLDVNPVSATQFEVIEGRGEGARGMWCAAALHSVNQLGVQRGRIYVAQARGLAVTAQGRKGVVFSTQAVGDAGPSPSVTVRQVGANLPVQHALQFCRDYDINSSDF